MLPWEQTDYLRLSAHNRWPPLLVVPQQQKTVQAKKTSGNTRQQAGHKSLKPVAVKVEKVGSPKTETSKQETGKETPKAEKTVARKTTPATATASSASVPAQNKAEATTAKPKILHYSI